jgi:hypothetical protein
MFDIFARGSNTSTNRHQTKATVRLNIENKNEYIPEFVLPEPIYYLKDGMPTDEKQKVYSYKVPENEDFVLVTKAVDDDKGLDGRLFYTARYLDLDDNFEIQTEAGQSANETGEAFIVTIPGRYLDSHSRLPIIFAVKVEDLGTPRLSNEIIVYLRPQPSGVYMPIYFSFDKYEFDLIENLDVQKQTPFRIRLVNDNMLKSTIQLEEINDPLNLINFAIEDDKNGYTHTATNHEIFKYLSPLMFNSDDTAIHENTAINDVGNELSIILYLSDFKRDFDKVYIENNHSSVYHYKLKAYIMENPATFTILDVIFNLKDANDNIPSLMNYQLSKSNQYIPASLSENFDPNTLVNINEEYYILKFDDADFSNEFGVKSIYCFVNDTRFYVDNEFISTEIDEMNNAEKDLNFSAKGISLLVRVKNGYDKFSDEKQLSNQVYWLNASCQDSYFNGNDKVEYLASSVVLRLEIVPELDSMLSIGDRIIRRKPVFEHETYTFDVNESWTGFIGYVNATVNHISQSNANLLSDFIVYSIEPNTLDSEISTSPHKLYDFIELKNGNEIYLKKKFDFENVADRLFDFNVLAYNHDHKEKSSRHASKHRSLDKANELLTLDINGENFNAFYSTARVILIIRDLNDELPKFVLNDVEGSDSYSFDLYVDKVKSGDKVGQIYAFDSDKEDWNILKFEIDESSQRIDSFRLSKIDSDNLNGIMSPVQTAFITTTEDLTPAKYEFDVNVYDNGDHITKCKVLINIKFKTPQLPSLSWFHGKQQPIDNNLYVLRATKSKLLSNEDKKIVSLIAKLDNTQDYAQNRLRYKQLDNNQFFRIKNNLKGDLYYTDDFANNYDNRAKQQNINVRLQPYYVDLERPSEIYILPQILCIQILIDDESSSSFNDNHFDLTPKFILPINNYTIIDVRINNIQKKANAVQSFENKSEAYLFKFIAIKRSYLANEDNLEFELVETVIVKNYTTPEYVDENEVKLNPEDEILDSTNLPFVLDPKTGILTFNSGALDTKDLLKLVDKSDFSIFNRPSSSNQDEALSGDSKNTAYLRLKVKVSVKQPTPQKSSFAYLYAKINLKQTFSQFNLESLLKNDKLFNVTFDFETSDNDNFLELLSHDPTTNDYTFMLKESCPPQTFLMNFVTFVNNVKTKHLIEPFHLVSNSPTTNSSTTTTNSPEAYLKYDTLNGSVKLIRKIDFRSVKFLNFSLFDSTQSAPMSRESERVNVCLKVKRDHDRLPDIKLSTQEIENGQNLVLVSVGDLNEFKIEDKLSVIASSTPMPMREPRPAIPELDMPSVAADYPRPEYLYNELNANKAALAEFNKNMIIKTYRLVENDYDGLENDLHGEYNVTVSFLPKKTSKYVIDRFNVDANGTHLIFSKKNLSMSLDFLTKTDLPNQDTSEYSYKFKVELKNEKYSKELNGELFYIDPRQLRHLLINEPENGRFQATLQRSSIHNTQLDLQPEVQIRNPFPFDLFIELTGDHSKYFRASQTYLKQMSTINFLPNKITVSLLQPLEDVKEIDFLTRMKFDIRIKSNSTYLNELLNVIGNLQVIVNLLSENKHEPRIYDVEPDSRVISLDEGFYANKEIARIKAMDRDRGDPGRLEYFLLGSYILSMNRTTGIVYLDGALDAETEQQIKFYCYSRDLAPKPFGMTSELIELVIQVKDVDEFKPTMHPIIMYVDIKENDLKPVYPNSIEEFVLECYDRDIYSSVNIVLESIRYVNKHDTFVYMDDPELHEESNRHFIKDMFRLVYNNESDLALNASLNGDIDSTQFTLKHKSTFARIALTAPIDYELLYKPNETFIRIDLSCSDGRYAAHSKILINIQDMNDNKPRFIAENKDLTITRNESNLLENLVQVQAVDFDLSPKYGNQSLYYFISYCVPNVYNVYIDPRTGQINSKLIIDLDTDEIIARRKDMSARLESFHDDMDNEAILPHKPVAQELLELARFKEYINNYNRITCLINVNDTFNQAKEPLNPSLSDSMKLTILIENVNDNAPEIDLENDYTIEVNEGEDTRGIELLKIRVFDRDDATGLKCLFPNGFTFYSVSEPFELRTGHDKIDPHTAWCILKVKDDTFIDLSDFSKRTSYLMEIIVWDKQPQPPVYPNKGSSSVQVRVRVLPVNKRPPQFINGVEEKFYVLDSIQENTLIGTIVATDFENPNPDRIIYKIDKNWDMFSSVSDQFGLKSNLDKTHEHWGTVGIYTKKKLSVKDSPYIISVIAYDGNIGLKDTLSSRKIIKVVVLNKGSMSVWSEPMTGLALDSYLVEVDEEIPENSFIAKIKANIPDEHVYRDSESSDWLIATEPNITYSLEDLDNPFYKINATTGEITTKLNSRLDYEEKDASKVNLMRNIRVKATSHDNVFNYKTYVSVTIKDLNDNSPIFEEYLLESLSSLPIFRLEENKTSPEPITIGHLKASDLDSGLNGKVNFKFDEASSNFADLDTLFQIDRQSGQISLRKNMGDKIDREKNDTIKMTVIAYDLGQPESLSTSLEISLQVLDINDNYPAFISTNTTDQSVETNFFIQENSMNFNHKFEAFDLDFGANATIYFSLNTQNQSDRESIVRKFRIDPITGVIILNSPLDYEERICYEFDVVCSDSGEKTKLSSKLRIKANAIDENDNAPKFLDTRIKSGETNRVYINESLFTDSLFVHKFVAFDLDSTENYQRTSYVIKNLFKIDNQYNRELVRVDELKDVFALNKNTGELTYESDSKLTDASITNEYVFEVEAYDEDKPSEFRTSLNFTLIILPSNNKLPIFLHKMKQNASLSSPLDQVESRQGFDKYLTVFRRSLDESKPINFVVDVLKAVDRNNHGIRYYLDDVEPINDAKIENIKSLRVKKKRNNEDSYKDFFNIGAEDGVLVASKIRTAYKDNAYKVKVRAVSTLDERLSTYTTLHIKMDNSSDSLFMSRFFSVPLNENSPADILVFKIKPLENVQRNLNYKLNAQYSTPEQVYSKWFKLNGKTGEILTNDIETIDYERFQHVLLSLDVYDSNQLFIENLILKVEIIDLNDNAPHFDLSYQYDVSIDEDDNSTINQDRLITTFKAYDLDGTFLNSLMEYSIVNLVFPESKSAANLLKTLDFYLKKQEQTGNVNLFKRSNVELDRDNEMIGNKIILVIKVEDQCTSISERLSVTKEITVNLIDLNDNYPEILNSQEFNKIELKEDYPLAQPFIKIKATDRDEGLNSQLVYQILQEKSILDPSKPFRSKHVSIDSDGNMFLINAIDYEMQHSIELKIKIFDKSSAPLGVFTQIVINVININDNNPTFDLAGACRFDVYEGPSSLMHKFVIADLDTIETEAKFDFRIVKVTSKSQHLIEEDPFHLDELTGELSVNGQLDRENIDNYKIFLTVTDLEIFGVRLESKLECSVNVLDINDNYPVFESLEKEFIVLPLINKVTFVNWFRVTDIDMGSNSSVEFQLVSQDKSDLQLFRIDTNGYLTMKVTSDNKKNPDLNALYKLKVIVSDKGNVLRLNKSLDISVEINQNYFKFNQQENNKLELTVDSNIINIDENSARGLFISKVKVLNSFDAVIKQRSTEEKMVKLTFKLLTCNDTFSINEITGAISVLNSKNLDYETIREFRITVDASEIVKSVKSANELTLERYGITNLIVKLNNLNDNPAEFNEKLYITKYSENVKNLPFELSLSSTNFIRLIDQDLLSNTVPKDQLTPIDIRLTGADSQAFRLVTSNSKGIATTNDFDLVYGLEAIETLDAEQKSKYEFEINSWDGMHKTKSQVQIDIIDLNDNAPIFAKKIYNFDCDENVAENTIIGQIKATDLDTSKENSEIFYRILSTHAKPNTQSNMEHKQAFIVFDAFKINVTNGQLYVCHNSHLLDREQVVSFNLTIMAYNIDGIQKDICHVIVSLNDLNDNTPKFKKSVYNVAIREKTSILPRSIANLNAIDFDLAENGTIRYKIDTINGERVTRDNRRNNQDDLENTNSTLFFINPLNGDLVLNYYIDMDLEEFTSNKESYEIGVIGYDMGSVINNKESCIVIVKLIDINDQHPKFIISSSLEYSGNIVEYSFPENAQSMDAPLFHVKATDPDYNHNQIKYFIDHDINHEWTFFSIDQLTGNVFTNIKFDYETKKEYTLRIIAQDIGIMIDEERNANYFLDGKSLTTPNDGLSSYTFNLSSSLIVHIKVDDLDDNEPEFSSAYKLGSTEVFTRNISDTLEVMSTVAILPLALDRDTYKRNTRVKYFIIDGNQDGKFDLNETSGELMLMDELDYKLVNRYQLTIRATSKYTYNELKALNLTQQGEETSTLEVTFNIVKDKLVIEFEEQQYYVSIQLNASKTSNEINTNKLITRKISNDLKNSMVDQDDNYDLTYDEDYVKRLQKSDLSLFFARAHLKQRKFKRVVKFNVDMLQLIKFSEQSARRLSNQKLVQAVDMQKQSYQDLVKDDNSQILFFIDTNTGKILVNKKVLFKSSYDVGDKFILTISAACQTDFEINVEDENTLTHLYIRLTEKDYTFIMPINRKFKKEEIMFNYLNPLRANYIPRVLETDGVKLSVQDLIHSTQIVKKQKDLVSNYDLIFQVDTRSEHKQVNLDLFVNMWKNYSAAFGANEFNNFIEREPLFNQARRTIEQPLSSFDIFSDSRPFYFNWLFWLLAFIGVLLIIILVFFVCCIKLTKKQQKAKRDGSNQNGIIIEYPHGLNPIYQDGVLNFNNPSQNPASSAKFSKKPTQSKSKIVPVRLDQNTSSNESTEYEDQELEMFLEDDFSYEKQQNDQIRLHHENI